MNYLKVLNQVVNATKGIIVIFMLFEILMMLSINHDTLTGTIGILFVIYMTLTISIFTLLKNKEDRDLILRMWKNYFSVVAVFTIIGFSLDANARDMVLEQYKTKLDYELQIKDSNAKKTFLEYKKISDHYLKAYMPEKVHNKIVQTEKKEKYTSIIWYINLSMVGIIVMTLFMLLWLLIEFHNNQFKERFIIFQSKESLT